MAHDGPLMILGASGQVGRMLHRLWQDGHLDFGAPPVWQVRSGQMLKGQFLNWDILHAPLPDLRPSGVIALAGVTAGDKLKENTELALAAVAVAKGAPVLVASSQAVYGVQSGMLSEHSPCRPQGAYGHAKLAMEKALAGHANVTCLRLGNVMGADQLSRAVARGQVVLDQFTDGQGPRRMMIGPLALGLAFVALLAQKCQQPILNLAQPGLVAMADLLTAAGADWRWQPASETALPALRMDLSAVQALIPLVPATPAGLIAEARLADWGAS